MAQGRLFKEFEAARAAAENRGADAGGPGRPEASRKPAGKEAGMTRADLKAHQRKAAGQSPAPVAEPARAGVTTRNGKKSYAKENRRLWRCQVEVYPSLTSGTVRWGVRIGL